MFYLFIYFCMSIFEIEHFEILFIIKSDSFFIFKCFLKTIYLRIQGVPFNILVQWEFWFVRERKKNNLILMKNKYKFNEMDNYLIYCIKFYVVYKCLNCNLHNHYFIEILILLIWMCHFIFQIFFIFNLLLVNG